MSTGSVDQHERILRAWHLAILRFAVTRDDLDRLNILAIAQEMDRFGRKERESDFCFFRKTSAELCLAIRGRGETGSAILRCYLEKIAEPRLKQAFAAALGAAALGTTVLGAEVLDAEVLGMPEPGAAPAKRRPKQGQDLFKGLAVRRAQA